MRTKSQSSMAITLMLGILALTQARPALAGTGSATNLGGTSRVVRVLPTVPTAPVRFKGENPSINPVGHPFGAPGLDGGALGMVQTLLFVLSH